MNQDERNQRVTEITSTWLDDHAGTDELSELNELLRGDPDACELYLNLTEGHAALVHESGGCQVADQVSDLLRLPPPSRISRVERLRKLPPAAMAMAAAVVVLLCLLTFLIIRPSPSGPELLSDGGIAVLSRLIDAEWAPGNEPLTEGDSLRPGMFSLQAGLAQIEFFSGASIIVEGPAELKLNSASKAECLSGKLRVSVPDAAHGFTMATPQYRAVDLGTEFALSVSKDGHSEVHVIDGEVRLDDLAGKELQRLTTGRGVLSRGTGGTFEEISADEKGFINRRELLARSEDDWRSRYLLWSKSRRKIQADESLLVHYDFENQQPWDRQIRNRKGNYSNGAVIGAQWVTGRWPGKGALEFKRITDRVRLNVPGEFDSLTLCSRVRIEGFDQWLSSLLLTDGFQPGEVHWQISDEGELILGICGATPLNQFSPPVIHPRDLGRWLQLAVTIDRKSGTIIHYLDGRVASKHTGAEIPVLRIGNAEIGNWNNTKTIRSLNGRIEELLIFDRALSADEVATLN